PAIQQPSQTPSFFAGFQPGYCVDECSDGEQMCINIQSSQPSPFYYECDNGHWTTVASCPDGEACRDYPRTAETPRQIICGGVCFPDQTACVDEDGDFGGELISTCDGSGQWGAPAQCRRGICTQDDQQSPGRAACEDECIPGTTSCQGNQQVTCSNAARYGDPEACPSGTACIQTPGLARLGCIECIPRDPSNPSSVPDSRCDDNALQVCGPDGTWATSSATTCPGGCTGSRAPNTARSTGCAAAGLTAAAREGEAARARAGGGAAGRAGGGAGGAGAGGRAGGGFGGINVGGVGL